MGFRNVTINKASGGDGIPAELFKILKDDAVKVLQSICQQIWKTQQWPQVLERSVFIPIPKKVNAKGCSVQLYSFRLLVGLCLGSFGLAFSGVWDEGFRMDRLGFEEAEGPEIGLLMSTGSWRGWDDLGEWH